VVIVTVVRACNFWPLDLHLLEYFVTHLYTCACRWHGGWLWCWTCYWRSQVQSQLLHCQV